MGHECMWNNQNLYCSEGSGENGGEEREYTRMIRRNMLLERCKGWTGERLVSTLPKQIKEKQKEGRKATCSQGVKKDGTEMMSKLEVARIKEKNVNTSKIIQSLELPDMQRGKEGIKQLYDGRQEKAAHQKGNSKENEYTQNKLGNGEERKATQRKVKQILRKLQEKE